MNSLRIAIVALTLAVFGGSLAGAAPKKAVTTTTIGGWTIQTTETDMNLKSGSFAVPHPFTMTRLDGSTVNADRAVGNYKKKQAVLYGHVSVHDANGTFGLHSAQAAHHDPATLSADTLKIDDASHLYDADGNVHYVQGQTTADAQTAHLNDVTHRLDLSGKVHVVQGERTLDAQTATYNTVTGDGEADGNAMMTFPAGSPSIATPKPIIIHGPKIP